MTKKSLERRVKALEKQVRSLQPPPCTCSPYDHYPDPDCPYHAGRKGGLAGLAEIKILSWE